MFLLPTSSEGIRQRVLFLESMLFLESFCCYVATHIPCNMCIYIHIYVYVIIYIYIHACMDYMLTHVLHDLNWTVWKWNALIVLPWFDAWKPSRRVGKLKSPVDVCYVTQPSSKKISGFIVFLTCMLPVERLLDSQTFAGRQRCRPWKVHLSGRGWWGGNSG